MPRLCEFSGNAATMRVFRECRNYASFPDSIPERHSTDLSASTISMVRTLRVSRRWISWEKQ